MFASRAQTLVDSRLLKLEQERFKTLRYGRTDFCPGSNVAGVRCHDQGAVSHPDALEFFHSGRAKPAASG